MRLAIFLGCLTSLILIGRWITIPTETQEPVAIAKNATEPKVVNIETVKRPATIAKAVFVQSTGAPPVVPAISNRIATKPGQDSFKPSTPPSAPSSNRFGPPPSNKVFGSFNGPPVKKATGFRPAQTFVSARPSIAMPSNAKNVRTLIRADYELPKDAASILEKLFLLDPDLLVETKIVDSENEATIILQVTTNAKAQQAIGNFISSLYPADKIAMLKQGAQEVSDEEATADSSEDSKPVSIKETMGLDKVLESGLFPPKSSR